MKINQSEEEKNWAYSLTNKFIETVSRFRSFTTEPIISSSKWVIYGLSMFLCVFTAIVLFCVAVFKIVDKSIPGGSWIAFFSLGLFSFALGVLILRKAKTDIH